MKPFLPGERSPSNLTRSLHRGLAGRALGTLRKENAAEIVEAAWGSDLIAKAVASPMALADFGLSSSRWAVLDALAPDAATVAVFGQSARVDMRGTHFMILPSVTMPLPIFVGEGLPHPIVNGVTTAQTMGPAHKMQIGCAITNELEFSTPENASTIIGRALKDSAAISLDAEFLSTTAASDLRDAGILEGVVPIAASVLTGFEALVADLAALAGALATAGCNADRAIYIAHPAQATSLRLLAGPRFANIILGSNALPAGQIVALDPWAIGSGFDGIPEITVSKEATAHFVDTSPAAISTVATPNAVAAPVFSAFQTNAFLLKVTTRLCWKRLVTGCVQTISGVAW